MASATTVALSRCIVSSYYSFKCDSRLKNFFTIPLTAVAIVFYLLNFARLTAFHKLRAIAQENGVAGMSLEEINEEIRLARRGE